MSQLVICDYCERVYNQTFGTEEEKAKYLKNWIHNNDYDFDACCDKCNEKLHKEFYQIYRCSFCEEEFDKMPADGMHTVHDRCQTKGGDYIDVDGECGPVYKV